jgi:hypothetical protein
MQLGTVGSVAITVGWLIALLVLILAILGMLGVLPETTIVVFGLFAALAVSRLL